MNNSIKTPPELYRQPNAILILYYLKDNGGRFIGNFSDLCDMFKISRRQGDYAVQILVEKDLVCAENVKGKKRITLCGSEDCNGANANLCENYVQNSVQTADIAEEKEKKGSPHTPFKEDKEKNEKKKKKKGTRFAENLEIRKAEFVESVNSDFPDFEEYMRSRNHEVPADFLEDFIWHWTQKKTVEDPDTGEKIEIFGFEAEEKWGNFARMKSFLVHGDENRAVSAARLEKAKARGAAGGRGDGTGQKKSYVSTSEIEKQERERRMEAWEQSKQGVKAVETALASVTHQEAKCDPNYWEFRDLNDPRTEEEAKRVPEHYKAFQKAKEMASTKGSAGALTASPAAPIGQDKGSPAAPIGAR